MAGKSGAHCVLHVDRWMYCNIFIYFMLIYLIAFFVLPK